MKYPKGTPYRLLEQSETREQEEPYRVGRGLALRFPLTTLVVITGLWGPSRGPVLEHEHSDRITEALQGRTFTASLEEIASWGWNISVTSSRLSRFRVWVLDRIELHHQKKEEK